MARPSRSGRRWVWASTIRMGSLQPAPGAPTVVLVSRAELLRQRSLLGADLEAREVKNEDHRPDPEPGSAQAHGPSEKREGHRQVHGVAAHPEDAAPHQ